MSNKDIDIVIAWVDGNDPKLRRKREAFLTSNKEDQREDVAGATRFASLGEIEFCILSILKYANFVRKIFIVTDDQAPDLSGVIERNFPDNKIPIEIVDHKVIFRGYEEYLPTFNCNSIEAMMWRIPDLSEKYVYFNDDVMLLAPITPEHWFVGDAPVYYGSPFSLRLAKIVRALKPRKNGQRVLGHKDPMIRTAEILGADHFTYFAHTPLAQLKSSHEKFYAEHPEVQTINLEDKFRSENQYNPQVLCYLNEEKRGNCVARSYKGKVAFLKPTKERPNYMKSRLEKADSRPELTFGCVSSLDKASAEQVEQFRTWFQKRLNVKLQ